MACSAAVPQAQIAFRLVILCALSIAFATGAVAQIRELQTSAPHAILIEAESGAVLFEKEADHAMAPASLAKLMTAEVVFHKLSQGELSLDQEFEVSEDAWRRGGAPSGGSTMFAPIHSRIAVRDLLSGLIIQSGNDAGIVLAEGIAGSEPAFARLMNERARTIGLTGSNFTNATGLPDPDMHVTARDLARLARHIILTYPEHYKLYGEPGFTWNKIHQRNRNPLLGMEIGADGLKTGYTREAGYGLVGSAVQKDLRIIVVISGLQTSKQRASEGHRLLEWGFNSFEFRVIFAEGQRIADARVFGGAKSYVPLTGAGSVRLMMPRRSEERVTARVVYTGPVDAPVRQGQPIGMLRVWRGDLLALEVPLQALEDVERGSMSQRAMDAVTESVISLFWAGVSRL